jgi:hypothetical protein
LKKIITLGIGIEKKIYYSGPGGIGIENSFRFRTLPKRTDPEYLNDTNNAGYWHPIESLDCIIGQFHWSDLEGINQSNGL